MTKSTPPILSTFLALTLLLPFGVSALAAQEHPEHPSSEHPKKAGEPVTLEALADAITGYVETESAKTEGMFVVEDKVENKKLALKLDKVHRERLSQIAPDTYFACADFVAADGTRYDLDIFMKGPDQDHLQATEVSVHKKNGEARYTWYEEEGIWKQRPVA